MKYVALSMKLRADDGIILYTILLYTRWSTSDLIVITVRYDKEDNSRGSLIYGMYHRWLLLGVDDA